MANLPVLYNISLLLIYFIHNNLHLLIPFPLSWSSSLSPLVSTSLFSISVSLSCYMCLVAQSYRPLCDPMDCSPPGSSVRGDSLGKNTGVGFHAPFQRIFPTQGRNPGLAHCRQILHHLSHQGSPRVGQALLEWGLSLLQGIFPTQELNRGLLHAGGFFISWVTREALMFCYISFFRFHI